MVKWKYFLHRTNYTVRREVVSCHMVNVSFEWQPKSRVWQEVDSLVQNDRMWQEIPEEEAFKFCRGEMDKFVKVSRGKKR